MNTHRSIRHEIQLQVTNFCVPISGRDGMGNGCHVHLLEGNVGVRLPAIPPGAKSFGENQVGTGLEHYSRNVVA